MRLVTFKVYDPIAFTVAIGAVGLVIMPAPDVVHK